MRIANILKESTVDGEGWRSVIFFQGCSHRCKGCHNPQTWNFKGGTEVITEDLIAEILEILEKDMLLDGITLSGGDPFYQVEDAIKISKAVKEKGYSVWAYTGFTIEQIMEDDNKAELLNYIDILVDGKFIKEQRTLLMPYIGSSNQRIIDVKRTLESGELTKYI